MQLRRIKISGFKSFLSPIVIYLPNGLCGIVGPNGSGKSNVFDAIRWVMGESSAKSLRGETLDDVIFNGSEQRKPAARASVELVFDNSQKRCYGHLMKYAEISIRRTLTRDGISEYFINGTKARRLDVREIFLGTGFGPRSYSVIEQGMISQIVESKPKELSAYFEEVSGVSRFREKRHETGLRLKKTQHNLERLDDMRSEVEKRLRILKVQAANARRYKSVKQQARLFQSRLIAVKWKQKSEQLHDWQAQLSKQEVELQKKINRFTGVESELELARKYQLEVNSELNQLHMKHYRVSSDISNVEGQIQQVRDNRARDIETLASQKEQMTGLEQSLARLQIRKENSGIELAQVQQQLTETSEKLQGREESLLKCELRLETAQKELDEIHAALMGAVRSRDLALSRLNDTASQKKTEVALIADLQSKLDFLESETSSKAIDSITQVLDELTQKNEGLKQKIAHTEELLLNRRLESDRHQIQLEKFRDRSQEAEIRLRTLERSLASMSQNDDQVDLWINESGLSNSKRISEILTVRDGWERAVDQVLGNKLSGIQVDDLQSVVDNANKNFSARLFFFEAKILRDRNKKSKPTLENFVECSDSGVEELLSGVFVADSLTQAWSMRDDLSACEFVVTPEGAMLGANWFSPAVKREAESGILETARLIQTFQEQVSQIEDQKQEKQQQLKLTKDSVLELEIKARKLRSQQTDCSSQIASLLNERSKVQVSHARSAANLEQFGARLRQANETVRNLDGQLGELQSHAAAEEKKLENIQRKQLEVSRRLQKERQVLKHQQLCVNKTIVALHKVEMKVQKLESDLVNAASSIVEREERLNRTRLERSVIEDRLSKTSDPTALLTEKLGQHLQESENLEARLSAKRDKVNEAEVSYRTLDQERLRIQISMESMKDQIQDRKVDVNRLDVQVSELLEKLLERNTSPEIVLDDVDDSFDVAQTASDLHNLGERLRRFDKIRLNFGAEEEFKRELQRKEYMDAQHADLSRAIATLKETIKKINQESRKRYLESFDLVNEAFQKILPELFGGGSGYLERFGDYPDQAGVRVFAQPKGKRINHIQSLSGGEKALTAIALLLSLFQINPSPVCLFDEIDAPLDDDNVGRLCTALNRLSNSTQLVMITHNKITMESVDLLLGVTMPEPNSSRILSVNFQEAQEYAA